MGPLSNMLKVRKNDLPLLYTVYFSFFTSGMMSTLIGSLLPSMKSEYELSYVLGGAVLSAHQIGNFTALILAGFLPYLLGRKKSTLVLSSGIIIGFTMMTLTGNPLTLIISFVLTGVGRGTRSNITNVLISEITENKTAGLNLLHGSFAIGAFLAPLVALLTTSIRGVHWRLAAYLLIVLELFVFLAIGRSTISNTPTRREKGTRPDFLTDSSYWINTGILFFYLCTEASVIGWLVTYFRDTGRLSASLSLTTSTALWVFILIGRIFCAFLSTRMNKNILLVILGSLQLLFFLLMIGTRSIVLTYISLFGFGLAMSGTYPTTLSTMDPRYNASTIVTGTTIATASVGAITMPIIVGSVAEKAGIGSGLATISITIVTMLVLMVVKLLRERPATEG